MKRPFLLLLFLLSSLITAVAACWTPETLPVPENVTDPSRVSYVSNPDHLLSDSAVRRINYVMYNLEKERGVRGLIIAVETIDPADPYTFTMAVARRHEVGSKANTGFVLMMAAKSQTYSLLTGSGLEKFLTDAQCSQLERNYMMPFMKQQRWDPAVEMVVYRIRDVLQDQEELVPDSQSSTTPKPTEEKSLFTTIFEWIATAAIVLYCLFLLFSMLVGLFFGGGDGDDGEHHRFFTGHGRSGGGHSWGSRGGGSFSGGGASGRH